MDVSKILRLTPEEVATAVITRREELLEELPAYIRERKKEVEYLEPLVRSAQLDRDETTAKVQILKAERNEAQKSAKVLRQKLLKLRDELLEQGRMKNPNPKWAKERLADKLSDIDSRLETEALSLNQEREMLDEMRQAVAEHEAWVTKRLESDPDMKEYKEGWDEHGQLLDVANAKHAEMCDLADLSEQQTEELEVHKRLFRKAKTKLNKAVELNDSGASQISYWNHRIESGFGNLKDGSGDLMAAANKIVSGEKSSLWKKPTQEGGDKHE